MVLSKSLKDSVIQEAILGKLLKTKVLKEDRDNLLKSLEKELNKKFESSEIQSELNDSNLILPENWIGMKLKDFTLRDISYGIVKLGNEDKNGVKVLRCSDVKSQYIDMSSIRTVTKDLSDRYKRTILNGGEIVINVRGTLGGCAIVDESLKGYNIAREVAVIDVPNVLNKEYILFCLLSPIFWNYMTGNLRGIAYKGLNINLLKEFIVPIPPINLQNEIVCKVNNILKSIKQFEVYEERLNEIRHKFPMELKYSILQEAYQGKLTSQLDTDSNVNDILEYIKKYNTKIKEIENTTVYTFPNNWKCVKLADATLLYTGNSISENIKKTKFMRIINGYDYIGTKDIGFDHKITYDNGVKIPFDEKGFKYADKDATLLCIEGGSAGKKIAILEKKVCFGNKLCAFHPVGINKKYLFYYLQSPIFLSEFKDKISGIIGGVSINKVKKMILPIPPIEEQERIVNKIEELFNCCEEL